MRVTEVETVPVGTPPPHKGKHNWLFVKLVTADGRVGWGECTMTDYRLRTLREAVEEVKERFVVGLDPFQVETLREDLYRGGHDLHVPGPVGANVVAGIEVACWDLIGKATDQPIYNLLGGRHNDELRTYTYLHYKWDPPEPPEDAAAAAREYVDQGYTGVKLDPLHPIAGPRTVPLDELEYAEEVVAAVREEVGNECDILFGTHGQLDRQTAVRLGRRLEPYDPLWFEEPVPPENVSEMAAVADATTVPVASGERITSKHAFAELLGAGAIDIAQPDVGLLGLLDAKKVAGMCETHYVPIAPWHYCGPIQGAANIQLDACTPNFLVQESIEDWDAFHNDLLREPIEWADGSITPPDGPGLGIEPDEDALAANPPNEVPSLDERPHYSGS